MSESHATTESHAAAPVSGHATVATYIRVAVVLSIVTAIEIGVIYVPGIPNPLLVVSLLIMSVIKFVLVVAFFMHLRYDSPLLRALFVGPLLIAIAIILALMALFGAFLLLPR